MTLHIIKISEKVTSVENSAAVKKLYLFLVQQSHFAGCSCIKFGTAKLIKSKTFQFSDKGEIPANIFSQLQQIQL